MTASDQPDVVIVGGGPVGLSAAVCLARLGVRSVVLERAATVGTHPKARGVRLRTMELFRQWGLEPTLRGGALPAEARRFIYCDTLAGQEIARSPSVGAEEAPFSPTTSLRVAQDAVERALRALVLAEPLIELRMATELLDLAQSPDEVTVLVAATGAAAHEGPHGREHQLTCRYVIGADGVGSTVRRRLGIVMEGQPVLAYWQSIYWHGDIDRWAGDRPCIQFFTGARAGRPATVASVDGHRRWVTMVTLPPSDTSPPPLDHDTAVRTVRQAVGDDRMPVDVLDVATWRLSATVAERWADRRVFLAGDAAHSFPPTGGFGMNTGVQDVHNLAWKMALVLQGRAGPGLLDSYQQERRPVAQANASWSVGNSSRVRDINQAIVAGDDIRLAELLEDQREHVLALEQDLGFVYRSTAVDGDGSGGPDGLDGPGGPRAPGAFRPAAVVGQRAPHAWVRSGGSRLSTLDLFSDTFVLLAGADHAGWRAAADALDPHAGPAVRVLAVGPHADADTDVAAGRDFDERYRLDADGAVLVRPDGQLAWRAADGQGPAELGPLLRRLVA